MIGAFNGEPAMLKILLVLVALAGYVTAALALYRHLRLGFPGRGAVLATGLVGFLAHGAELARTALVGDALDLSFYHALSIVTFVTVALVLAGGLVRRMEVPGLILFPLAGVVLLAEWGMESPPLLVAERPWQFNLHIALAVLAYATLSVAAAHAVVLWIHERRLRRHQLAGMMRGLPPLASTESLMFQLIVAGFALLTLTLVTGAVFVDNLFAQHLVHKTVLSIVAWVVFGVLLWGRWRFGWRGRTAVGWTLAGMILLVLAYFGSKLVLEVILGRTV